MMSSPLSYRPGRVILQVGINASDAANARQGGFHRIADRGMLLLDWTPATISTTLGTRQSFRRRSGRQAAHEENDMKNPLDSLWGTIICGVLLTAVLYFIVKSVLT
jgi:hypothetical protein